MKRTVTHGLRAKMMLGLVLIAVPVVASGVFAVLEARWRGQLFDAMWSQNVAITTAAHQGMAASRTARLQLQDAVLLPDESGPEKIEQCDRRLGEAELSIRMFVEFLTWGSESDAFKGVMDGAVYAEWTRQGWHQKLSLREVPDQIRELAGQTSLYFVAFFKNAHEALARQRDAFRQQASGETARAQELAAAARRAADRAMRYQALGNQNLNDMVIAVDALTERSRRNVREAHERRLRYLAAVDAGLLAAAMMVAWVFAHRVLVRPVLTLAGAVERIATEKNYAQRAPKLTRDELGLLTDALNELLAEIESGQRALQEANRSLQAQAAQIAESVIVLGSSARQILEASTRLVASATETATAVSQTSATVEEVRQTAQLSSEKAQAVAVSAQETVEVSKGGRRSVEETIEGMKRIRQQMDAIADSMMRLSEQAQVIGQIIATVDDLAAQSNLLAVNAAIEAAKAGEQGKGFAVVAQEIKNLAEQSKQATVQVRAILNEIQKATAKAILVTEQGSKAVEAGTERSTQAATSIETLAASVVNSAQAATQIAASSRQQLVGVDQVAAAMASIKEATAQNAASARQLETFGRHLNELGEKLKELVERYKT